MHLILCEGCTWTWRAAPSMAWTTSSCMLQDSLASRLLSKLCACQPMFAQPSLTLQPKPWALRFSRLRTQSEGFNEKEGKVLSHCIAAMKRTVDLSCLEVIVNSSSQCFHFIVYQDKAIGCSAGERLWLHGLLLGGDLDQYATTKCL